jgi:hypothetical protein
MNEILQWSISLQAVIMLWLMGNGNRAGPVVGLFGQIIWMWYALKTEQWGLVLGICMFTLVHARNLMKFYAAPAAKL